MAIYEPYTRYDEDLYSITCTHSEADAFLENVICSELTHEERVAAAAAILLLEPELAYAFSRDSFCDAGDNAYQSMLFHWFADAYFIMKDNDHNSAYPKGSIEHIDKGCLMDAYFKASYGDLEDYAHWILVKEKSRDAYACKLGRQYSPFDPSYARPIYSDAIARCGVCMQCKDYRHRVYYDALNNVVYTTPAKALWHIAVNYYRRKDMPFPMDKFSTLYALAKAEVESDKPLDSYAQHLVQEAKEKQEYWTAVCNGEDLSRFEKPEEDIPF